MLLTLLAMASGVEMWQQNHIEASSNAGAQIASSSTIVNGFQTLCNGSEGSSIHVMIFGAQADDDIKSPTICVSGSERGLWMFSAVFGVCSTFIQRIHVQTSEWFIILEML